MLQPWFAGLGRKLVFQTYRYGGHDRPPHQPLERDLVIPEKELRNFAEDIWSEQGLLYEELARRTAIFGSRSKRNGVDSNKRDPP